MAIIWDKVFKNGPIKICGRQLLKNLKKFTWSIFVPYDLLSPNDFIPNLGINFHHFGGSVGVITVIINFGSVAVSVKYYIYSSLKIILKCPCLILATSSDIRRGYVNAKAYMKRINY